MSLCLESLAARAVLNYQMQPGGEIASRLSVKASKINTCAHVCIYYVPKVNPQRCEGM